MELCGRLLLVCWLYMFYMVVLVVPLQRNASIFPAVCDGGNNGAVAGPTGCEIS